MDIFIHNYKSFTPFSTIKAILSGRMQEGDTQEIMGQALNEVSLTDENLDTLFANRSSSFYPLLIVEKYTALLLNHPENPLNPISLLNYTRNYPSFVFNETGKYGDFDSNINKVKKEIVKSCQEKGAELPTQFSIYTSSDHGSLKIECDACMEGEPLSLAVGFGPLFIRDLEDQQEILLKLESRVEILGWFRIRAYDSVISFLEHPSIQNDFLDTLVFFPLKILQLMHLVENTIAIFPVTLDLMLTIFGDCLYKTLIGTPYQIFTEDPGAILSSHFTNFEEKLYTHDFSVSFQKSFLISDERAFAVALEIIDFIEHKNENVTYQLFKHNCLDFVQEMYEKAGLEGDVFKSLDWSLDSLFLKGPRLIEEVLDDHTSLYDYFQTG